MNIPFTSVLSWKVICPKLAGLALAVFLFNASLAATEPAAGRLTGTFEGIEFEYSPGQEELARLLAHRLLLHNQELAGREPAKAEVAPLSPAEMRANRAAYLQKIAAQLALARPTSLQEECYDAFLDNYEQTMILFQIMRDSMASARFKRVTIWERPELVRRLEGGEKVAGFAYDPATKTGTTSFFATLDQGQNIRLKELAEKRDQLRLAYKLDFGTKDGVASYRASAGPKKTPPAPAPAVATAPAELTTEWFPIVVPVDLAGLPAEELADKLWSGSGDKSVGKLLDDLAGMAASILTTDPVIAFLVLHETTELGVIDHYFHGPDRRWFCDGVANFVSWRVLRDLHGEAVATRAYNLPEQLKQYADLREQADLRKWPATENQSEEDQHSRLNSARYAYATRAVALMQERGGADLLPRLFAEIGKTKPDKVSIKTVEKAWRKLTGTNLDTILAETVKPRPATKPAGE